eukprot:332761-Rhodomonas_salina.3
MSGAFEAWTSSPSETERARPRRTPAPPSRPSPFTCAKLDGVAWGSDRDCCTAGCELSSCCCCCCCCCCCSSCCCCSEACALPPMLRGRLLRLDAVPTSGSSTASAISVRSTPDSDMNPSTVGGSSVIRRPELNGSPEQLAPMACAAIITASLPSAPKHRSAKRRGREGRTLQFSMNPWSTRIETVGLPDEVRPMTDVKCWSHLGCGLPEAVRARSRSEAPRLCGETSAALRSWKQDRKLFRRTRSVSTERDGVQVIRDKCSRYESVWRDAETPHMKRGATWG